MLKARLLFSGIAAVVVLGLSVPVMADTATDSAVTSRFPAFVLEVPDTVTDVLIASTGSATMHRFVMADGEIQHEDQRYMSIGLNGVGKRRAWDKKTPLGVYFITKRLDTSKLHDKYGVAAFPLDYPNTWDRYNERTGDGIWLHGVDRHNPNRPPLDTDGCLAMPNEEILQLAEDLEPLVTPVIVAREIAWADRGELENARQELKDALNHWRQSMMQGNLLAYLSLYADDFRYSDMNKEQWSEYREGAFELRQFDQISLENLMLLADPEEPDLYLSRFTQVLTTAHGPVATTKRLYWRRHEDGLRIVAEDAGG